MVTIRCDYCHDWISVAEYFGIAIVRQYCNVFVWLAATSGHYCNDANGVAASSFSVAILKRYCNGCIWWLQELAFIAVGVFPPGGHNNE